ncbi:MAG: hypothetical protein ACOYYJ_01595 [Chloroflexota bacterium]
MSLRRNLSSFLVGLALLGAGWACVGSLQPMSLEAPSAPGEPAEAQPSPIPELLAPTMTPAFPPVQSTSLPPQPAIQETRHLTLEFPPVMRAGDATRIRLQLEVDDQGNLTPTAVVEGNVVTGQVVKIPDLYETHNVMVEARLDMAGMDVSPPGAISEPLQPGLPVTFYWSVRPDAPGLYQGTAWLHLQFVPKSGGEGSRIPISVQFLEIEVRSLWGLSGGAARGLGTVGSAVGAVLGFPFVDDIFKWIWNRRRRNV